MSIEVFSPFVIPVGMPVFSPFDMPVGMPVWFSLLLLVTTVHQVICLNNGLARTPPMGWLSWERYRCNIDCDADPDNCISEKLYMTMADLMVSEGYKDAGYQYVNIDDCWMTKQRDKKGSLVPDPKRFPHGIKYLADHIHSKGLKMGIYEDFGTKTCGGYPGSKFYLQKDAETFAAWGVDMLKLDGCYTNKGDYDYGYPIMEFFLNRTGRPMLYSCSWPAYISNPNYVKIAKYCNIWRNYADIGDSWDSVRGIIEYYGKDKGNFSKVAGPGNFNDPDMLIIGDYGLSYEQQKTQMALWSIMASPLFMSSNLRKMPPASKALLLNKRAIAVNQDPLGIQGTRIDMIGKNIEVWTKPISPKGKSIAFAFLNTEEGGGPTEVSYPVSKLGAIAPAGYSITEVFSGTFIGKFKPHDSLNVTVDPTGVFFGVAEFRG
ncbi:alpha-N-acetylgalactosaminidase-like isoform X2 [Mercenaria mercenaria]|uniref:alpha-N-acetylgalactosaminidase-like isoform X2 n=1 Tax=Mercenaria mercenaria TaxID=6596 RepID=UPI00234EFAF6|nr:alpha-N-acetylgalactosaminidase-like isoform X2 [Mercenaria mercenaria]